MKILYFLVSFLTSLVGAICGIGGGVIIKPVLDSFALDSVSAISFLSGCTVLAMSCYSVLRNLQAKERIPYVSVIPLTIGGAAGGVLGKYLFNFIKQQSQNEMLVGQLQAICLLIATLAVFWYMLLRSHVQVKNCQNRAVAVCIGCGLGVLSSFLGIGGGPINLIVLYYFFGMDTKKAAQCSLFVILFSQAASLVMSFLTNSIPAVSGISLVLMISGGLFGGMLGRTVSKKLPASAIDKLLLILLVVIGLICVRNIIYFRGV